MNSYWMTFLQSTGLELPVYFLALRRGMKPPSALGVAFLLNGLTHPLVFFGWMALPVGYLTAILCAEGFAVLSEALLLVYWIRSGRLSLAQGLAISLLANLLSWQLAPLLTAWRNGWL